MSLYITTPLYYVNDTPHVGHAYTTVLCDVIHRYYQLFGEDTFFLTGTDEHGQKVQNAARRRKLPVKDHIEECVSHFQKLWKTLQIKEDFFMRTTMEFHKKAVQSCLQELWDKGEIYKKDYEGFYCESEEIFYTSKELIDGKTPLGNTVSLIKEENYFFRMSKYQNQLIKHIEKNPDFIRPISKKNEVLGFLKRPLEDLSISRPKTRLNWGIELPFDKDHVTYVWFDALLNYATAVGYRQKEKQESFDRLWPQALHIIGKDILITHAVYWPTMLMALQTQLPKGIFAHGWWLTGDNEKMSKSKKNVIKPLDVKDIIGPSGLRYFLTRSIHFGSDAQFKTDLAIGCVNAELANNLGNLLSRVNKLVQKGFNGFIPKNLQTQEITKKHILSAMSLAENVKQAIKDLAPHKAVDFIIHFLSETNRYLEELKPWNLLKDNFNVTQKDIVGEALYTCLESLRIAGILLSPIMPLKMNELLLALNWNEHPCLEDVKKWGLLQEGSSISESSPLFRRIDTRKE